MEIEENRGFINKKAFEDKFTTFCQFQLGALSILSTLSYSCTLRPFLEYTSIGKSKAKEGQEINGKQR